MKKNYKKFFPGYVYFKAEGADLERFITFCVKNGIEISDYSKTDLELYAKITAVNYKKLRKPARMFGIKIKIYKKSRILYFKDILKNNIGFVAGLMFALIFLSIMNLFIWEINITGNKNTENEDIISSVNRMGLETGTLAKKHFVQDIEWYILRENKGLASAEINIQGSKANIIVNEIKENEISKSDDDIPINIIASKYGIIRQINVFDGQSSLKPGDAVNKGDLLVSAVYEDRHKKLTLKHARANVIAETDYNLEISFPLEQIVYEKGKVIGNKYEIKILGKSFSLGTEPDTSNIFCNSLRKTFCFFHIKLPIELVVTKYYGVKENNVTYNFDKGREESFKKLEEKEKTEMKNMEIISKKTEEMVKDDRYIVKAEYIVLMDIAKEQPIESDIPWKNTDDIS